MSEYVVDRENVWPYGSQREEIVRCRDCKHYGLGRRCGWSCRFVKPDGFCAWGERKVEG